MTLYVEQKVGGRVYEQENTETSKECTEIIQVRNNDGLSGDNNGGGSEWLNLGYTLMF